MGEFLFWGFLLICFAAAMLTKVLGAADQDGKIKTEASHGFVAIIQKFMK